MTLNLRVIAGFVIVFVQLFGAFFGALLTRAMLRSSAFVDAFSFLGVIDVLNQYPPNDEADHLQFANRFQVDLQFSILRCSVNYRFI